MLTYSELEEISSSLEADNGGFDINQKDDDGWLLIHSVAYYGHMWLLRLVTENCKDVDIDSKIPGTNMTALLLAATSGHYDAVFLLLSKGADVNAVDYLNRNALHLTNSAKIAELLLDNGINVNLKSKSNIFGNETPLELARREGKLAVASAIEFGTVAVN